MIMKNVLIIDLDKCFECGSEKEDMHHVIPKSKGGEKMIPLCTKCHGLVHNGDFVKHRVLQKEGIKRVKQYAVDNGLPSPYQGRKKGSFDSPEKIINRHQDIVECLNNKLSLRVTAKKTSKSLGTVQKVKKYVDILNKVNDMFKLIIND